MRSLETTTNQPDSPNLHNEKGLSILSLDGGGVRGLSTLFILKTLMAEVNSKHREMNPPRVKPCEIFDLIGGTSTGGLIAIMLGRLQMDVDECIVAYTRLMKSVFEKSSFLVDWRGRVKGRFDPKVLEKEIKAVIAAKGYSESELFNDGVNRGCKVFVCAVVAETKRISQLRSYDVIDSKSNKMTIWQAVLATCAAASCFDPVTIGSRVYMDGGREANNPVHLVEVEARKIWLPSTGDLKAQAKCLVSLGTGHLGVNSMQEKSFGPLSKTLMAIVMETEYTANRFVSTWEGGYLKRYFRFNVEQGLEEVGLAEYKKPGIVEAATEAYMNSLEQKFKVDDCVKNLYESQSRLVEDFSSVAQSEVKLLQEEVHHWEVPYFRNRSFVGRETELRQLGKLLSAGVDYQRVAAITGLGGIGKTQIAIEYCYRLKDELKGNCSVFWVHANNMASFEQGYLKIGQVLKIPGIEKEKADVKQLVSARLSKENKVRWLLIIDNADDIGMFNRAACYIPTSCRGSIIFTTRNRNAALSLTKAWASVIEIQEMNKIDSKKVLTHALIEDASDDDASNRLIELLECLPLAIVQAAAYINKTSSSIQEYILLYESSEQHMTEPLNDEFNGHRRYRDVKYSVATTWFISFNQILRQDQLAADYLAFMSLIDRKAIPESLLPPAKTPVAMAQALETLKGYAFIKMHQLEELNRYEKFYDMHRLVHLATRIWLRSQGELRPYSGKTLERVASAFPTGEPGNITTWTIYLPHARCILEASDLPIENQQAQFDLLYKVACCLDMNGQHDEAYPLILRRLAETEKALGPEHPMTLQSIYQLANNLASQKRFSEAETMCRRAVGSLKETLESEHVETLKSLTLLAMILEEQDKYKESEELYRSVLEVRKRMLGQEHVETLTSLNNLAISLEKQGHYEQAANIHQQVLEVREKVLGSEHPDTLQSLDNFAVVLGWQGHYKKMEEMHRRMREAKKGGPGATLQNLEDLATVSERQGHYKRVEEMHSRVLEVRQRVLGMEHPDTLVSLNNLGSIIYDQCRYKEAEQLYQRAVEARMRVLGEKHPNTLNSLNNLGIVYGQQGKYEEAAQIHRRVLKERHGLLGPMHPHTSQSSLHLSSALKGMHRYREAEMLAMRALRGYEKTFGPEHPNTTGSRNLLKRILAAQNEEIASTKIKMEESERHPAGDEAALRLLAERHDVVEDSKYDHGLTTLLGAAGRGRETGVRLLLENGAEIQLALHQAAENGHEAVVRLLLKKGLDVDARTRTRITALHGAARNGHEAVVMLLLEKGADVNAKDENGLTALHKAVRNRHEVVVRLLLEHKADTNAKTNSGWTALHGAARSGHEAVVRLLQAAVGS